MKTRLRNQPVTVKPRVVVNGDSFKVEYFGTIVREHVGTGYPTFEMAIAYANTVAQRHPDKIRAINRARNHERLERIVRGLGAA